MLCLQAPSPQQLASGRPLGGENGHQGAIWRRLEEATKNLEQLGRTRMTAHSLLSKHGFYLRFPVHILKKHKKASFYRWWMLYFFHTTQ